MKGVKSIYITHRHALDMKLCVIEMVTLYEPQGLSNDDHKRNQMRIERLGNLSEVIEYRTL